MLILIDIVFVVFELLVFTIILPIPQRIKTKIINLIFWTGVSLILYIVSLGIFAQILLLFMGDTQQIKYNISHLLPENVRNYKSFFNAIELSIQYDASFFIVLIVFYTLMLIFLYFGVNISKKNLIIKLLFVILVTGIYYSLPFSVIDNHNESIARKKQEVLEAERVKRISDNSDFLNKHQSYSEDGRHKYLFLPSYSTCEEINYSDDSYYYHGYELSCRETKSFCMKVRYWYKDDVQPEYFDMLENSKFECTRYDWDKLNNK